MTDKAQSFSRLRSFFWPIHRHELSRFVPMLIIFFLICFNYNLLRVTKDSLVVTARSSGAEALPFLKVWAILPMAFFFTYLFTRLSNKFKKENIFYIIVSGFLAFFLIFGFVLYPLRDQLHPNDLADKMQNILPIGFKGLIAVFRNWTYTAFYVMSEMWSTIVMTVLFWGFANDVTGVKDAKRFYGLLGIGANLSSILSGEAATWISRYTYNPNLPFGQDAWGQSVIYMVCLIVVSGLICMLLYRRLHKNGHGYNAPHVTERAAKEAPVKMGLRKNFAYLAKSKYLLSLALIVLCYNISINLIEVIWKDQLHQLYPNPKDYNAYMGRVLTSIGIVSTLTSLFITGNVLRKTSWTFSAMISPLILLVTGIGFFSFLLFKNSWLQTFAAMLATSTLGMTAFFGSLQNCFARASKYTFFDATKEMAFVPLSNESKQKGKSAIDGVGSRLGKSGGSMIHQGLLVVFGTVSLSAPFVGVILLITIGSWMLAVKTLGKQFQELENSQLEPQSGTTSSQLTKA
jgi:ATP:ADP antiporter, AAA family